ncbi:hypothetical protein D4764_10G0006190 [Takifugu flavidus]|uniref:Uncharacterized protein n=1 Tax=Takifugu flavidus TaxID=433684 RepID=A0A5C6PKZ6_9TELE|nr:hypothetical protein D4764_10G0006190 [Takifugu flavidus]
MGRRMGAGGSHSVTSIYPPDEKHLQRQLETPNDFILAVRAWSPHSLPKLNVELTLKLTEESPHSDDAARFVRGASSGAFKAGKHPPSSPERAPAGAAGHVKNAAA